MRASSFGHAFRRFVCMAVSVSIISTLVPLPGQVAMAAEPIDNLATEYLPSINETIDASGFKHPGVGFTKEMLENLRTQVRAKKEPWHSHFNNMLTYGEASRTPNIRNLVKGSDPLVPAIYGLDSQAAQESFIWDAVTAYTQAILYLVTGDEVYRANGMRIIRLYAQMDPARYAYYTDSHIHTGIPMSRMMAAAEILRYTSAQNPALAWTEDDTQKFTANLVVPVVQTFNNCNCRFMNQHLYTTIGKMSGAIFMGDRESYNQAVEWFTVNKDAPDPAWTGSIKQLFRLVTRNDLTGEEVAPNIQHVEMGRDQAHGAGDLTNTQILSRMMMAQGTKVDPVTGTPSTEPNAVGPYEFLNDRVLAVHELFGSYMSGFEIPWVPTAMSVNPDGSVRAIYPNVSSSYRGRLSQNTWEAYYYYKYVRGLNLEQVSPNFTKIYAQRQGYNWNGRDGGGDYWMAIPAQAADTEGAKYLPKPIVNPYREVEHRFTALDGNSAAHTEGATSYVKVTATPEGTRLAVISYANNAPNIGLRIRTSGLATMDINGKSVPLPDTQGQWRYVVVQTALGDFLPLTITGAGTTVDIDHIHIQSNTLLSPPVFKIGNADLTLHSYAGATLATTIDLSATDPNAADVVSYKVNNLPPGASFDPATAAFSWKPTQAGTYPFIVEASDGTSVSSKRITIVVGADRQDTVATVAAPFKPDTLYVTATRTAYQNAFADMQNTIGSGTDEAYFQKLAALKSAVAGLRELTPLLKDGSMDYTDLFFMTNLVTNFGAWASQGVDFNPDTFIAFTIAKDNNRSMTLDFGPSFKISANAFKMQPRTSFPERIGGVTIFGSNDLENWTRITPGETLGVEEMQTLEVQEELRNQRYRFIKIHMIRELWSYNILEPGEFRIFGTRYETVNKLSKVTLSSDQAKAKNRIVTGDTMKLSFQSTEPINNVTVTIQGEPATVTTTDNLNWTATAVVKATTAPGMAKFLLNYKTAEGVAADPTLLTTDASSLFVANVADVIKDVTSITTLIDSTHNRSAAATLGMVNSLFDSNLNTISDFRIGTNNSGTGSYIVFDFKAGKQVNLTSVELAPRQDNTYGRINGTVIQGSHDNTNWTTLTPAAALTLDWQLLPVPTPAPYRYLRIYNPNAWFGNLSEVRFHGTVIDNVVDVTAAVSISRSGLTMNRFTNKYTGTVTITNTGAENVSGPLQLHLQGLSAGVTLDNKTGEKAGVPYIALPATDLAPGQSVTLTTTFSNPSKVSIGYTPKLMSIR